MANPIMGFRGEHDFLGNDYLCDIVAFGFHFPSVDHAYQAAKSTSPVERYMVSTRPTALAAWQTGQGIKWPKGWELNRLKVMRELLKLKFHDMKLREKLLSTGGAELVHVNSKDSWWGRSSYCTPPMGGNRLGLMLMEVRKHYVAFKRNILV